VPTPSRWRDVPGNLRPVVVLLALNLALSIALATSW
jgi:hypothetical protein